MKRRRLPGKAIKEAFDNLPCGICYFGENGIPVLCNRTMHRLAFALTGRDLQLITDLTDALTHLPSNSSVTKERENYILSDGSVWCFTAKKVQAEETYIEYLATDVTELYRKKQALIQSTAEHGQMVANMRKIVDNVTNITREEEILTMKMQIHGEVGVALQRLRRYHASDCPPEEKQEIINRLEEVVDSLMGGIGKTDEIDPLAELLRIAATLGVTVEIQGVMPTGSREKNIIIMAMRECITNTLRHADGNLVKIVITEEENYRHVRMTNNGLIPDAPIVEGGGLTSLRRQIEKAGGMMKVENMPVFALVMIIPKERT